MKKEMLVCVTGILLNALTAQAVVVDAFGSGWYRESDGWSNTTPGNNATYVTVGINTAATGTHTYRNFFAFDFADLSDEVFGAYLEVWNPAGGFNSTDELETYTLFDVETPVNELGVQGMDTYNDLGSGTEFGTYAASALDNATLVKIYLNSDAILAINAARGDVFAVGGALTTLDGHTVERFLSNGKTDAIVRRLVLDTQFVTTNLQRVPDHASTLTLLGMAVMGIGMVRRRLTR